VPMDNGVAVVIRSDNRIIMGGYSNYATTQIALACYNADGTMHLAFGTTETGKVLQSPPVGTQILAVSGVVLQTNDFILVTGTLIDSSNLEAMFVARFDSLGKLDVHFGAGGFVITNGSNFNMGVLSFDNAVSNAVLVQPSNGFIVIGGHVRKTLNSQLYLALVRYNTAGALDTTFGMNGKVCKLFNKANNEMIRSIAIQKNGNLVLAMTTNTPYQTPVNANFMVARFTSAGVTDMTFTGSGGIRSGSLVIPNYFPKSSDNAGGLQIDGNDKIVVGGISKKSTGESCFAIARLTKTGTLDHSFGKNGQATLDLSTASSSCKLIAGDGNCVALQADNKPIIVGGYVAPTPDHSDEGFALARFNTNGKLDTTFGMAGMGYVLSNIVAPNTEVGYSVAMQPNGKILVGGTAAYISKNEADVDVNAADMDISAYTTRLISAMGTHSNRYFTLARYTTIANASEQPVIKPTTTIDSQPVIKPISQPVIKPISQPVIKPISQPVIKPISQPVIKPISQPVIKSITTAKPPTTIDSQPATKPAQSTQFTHRAHNPQSMSNDSFVSEKLLNANIGIPIAPIAPICFPAGTQIWTDQGNVRIEQIKPGNNTIRGKEIVAITKTINPFNRLICFEKGSLGHNVPSEKTNVSMEHCIVYKNRLIHALNFVNNKGIHYVNDTNDYLYNVLLKTHSYMIANNMKVETLNPTNYVAKLFSNNELTDDERTVIVHRMNNHLKMQMKTTMTANEIKPPSTNLNSFTVKHKENPYRNEDRSHYMMHRNATRRYNSRAWAMPHANHVKYTKRNMGFNHIIRSIFTRKNKI